MSTPPTSFSANFNISLLIQKLWNVATEVALRDEWSCLFIIIPLGNRIDRYA